MPRVLYSPGLYFKTAGVTVLRQSLPVAATTINPSDYVILTNTSGGALTVTAAPTIPNGFDGERCLLLNVSANNIVLQDQGTLANSNLRLSAATITLGTRDSLWLLYSHDIGNWVQIGQTNVI